MAVVGEEEEEVVVVVAVAEDVDNAYLSIWFCFGEVSAKSKCQDPTSRFSPTRLQNNNNFIFSTLSVSNTFQCCQHDSLS